MNLRPSNGISILGLNFWTFYKKLKFQWSWIAKKKEGTRHEENQKEEEREKEKSKFFLMRVMRHSHV